LIGSWCGAKPRDIRSNAITSERRAPLAAQLKQGDRAPGFSAQSTVRDPLALSELLQSKKVVLAFFPKAFTGG